MGAAMEWKKKVPTKPGIYLRKNPVASQVVRNDVYLVGKVLYVNNVEGGAKPLKKWGGAKFMWWLGPMPEPPETDRA